MSENERVHGKTRRITGVATHHYFIVDVTWRFPVKDNEGRIRVWTSRQAALAWGDNNAKAGKLPITFYVVGMGDEKFDLFKRENKFIIME